MSDITVIKELILTVSAGGIFNIIGSAKDDCSEAIESDQ